MIAVSQCQSVRVLTVVRPDDLSLYCTSELVPCTVRSMFSLTNEKSETLIKLVALKELPKQTSSHSPIRDQEFPN